MKLTVIIVASDVAQALQSVAGRPMVRYVVDAARVLEPDPLVVVTGHGADPVRQAVGDGVLYVSQGEPLGAGHALQLAEQAVAGRAETVLVLPGDTPLIRAETLRQMIGRHQSDGAAVTVLTARPPDPSGADRIVRHAATGQLLAIVKEREATPEQQAIAEVNSGIYCARDGWLWPSLSQIGLSSGGEVHLSDLVALAWAQGERVSDCLVADALEVSGLASRLRLARGEAEMRRRIHERWIQAGVTFVHPEVTYVDADVVIGADTVLWPNTFLQGETRIGRGCILGPGSVIRDSTVGDRCKVELSVLEGAVMEEDSEIGPFGHLRKGAHLAPGVHMGNFGEVKNSYLGPGVKMGHMSYLGDATVGAGANIGAGTITCNYDGKRKHRTVIGEGAFIGSDTMLVAPVQIGDGAMTGAGSVVTHDVPPGNLVYGVPARVQSAPISPLPGEGVEGDVQEAEVGEGDHS